MDEKEAQSIGQILMSKTLESLSQRPDGRLCGCGATIEPVPVAGRWFVPQRCQDCDSKFSSQMVREELRQQRKDKVERLQSLVAKSIPPLFRKAHLRDLGESFRRKLLSFSPGGGLVVFGPVGGGKTYALAALARYLIISKHKTVKRVTFKKLCEEIRNSYTSPQLSAQDVKGPYEVCDYLILEDVGVARSIGKAESDFNNETLTDLLDTRLEACRPTFITTNKNRANFESSFDERIASRLRLFSWIGVGGKDRRKG